MNAKGTALITGASSGIGATFARQLAFRGYDLILVARRADRLQALATELCHQFSIQAEVLAADLTAPDDLKRTEQRIADHDSLTMLVNNAGFGLPGTFASVPMERSQDMIDVHVIATTRLCHAALPGMMARKQGAIINVSSLAALIPVHVAYSATKAYINMFSEALQEEVRGDGIRVQALCPGFTVTEFHDTPDYDGKDGRDGIPKFLWMSANDVVRGSLSALEHGPVIYVPGTWYRLAAVIMRSALAPVIIRAFSGRSANH